MDKYNTIVIDPPWTVKNNLKDVRYYRSGDHRMPYSQMTDREIMMLPIDKIANDNCDLFIWSITSKIPVCFDLLKWWGFKYIDFFAWDKEIGVPVNGIYRSVEWVVYGYKGKMGINKKGKFINSMIREKRTVHSRKPDVFYETLKSNTKHLRLDMFAREKRDGFHVWGNEVESDISLQL
ncbi:MT-A70 family methyltransferase [Candidatus Dojkabacteria bacterium]|jgi:N6-adenosine-specific RNA methylase IME4|nr:MT-A70 family methyltransferase [Candidatus Dojkabacteria bacterium]